MKVSDYMVTYLEEQGVKQVFELSGGMITHLLDSIQRRGTIATISMHHEQGAAFAADGAGRMTGVPGVALATSGPGATNLLTGIASCYFDSTPAVFITGQVNRHEQKGSLAIRQLGFQETDIASMALPITKASWQIKTVEELPVTLANAFSLARTGRPGPVLVDIPMDIQRAEIAEPATSLVEPEKNINKTHIDGEVWRILLQCIRESKRPLILAGGGIRSGRSIDLFREVVERFRIPVVHSLMGTDVLDFYHPLRVGMIGSYGNRWANLAIGKSDLLIVLGSRLDVRQTGSKAEAFKQGRFIFHVDCDPAEINNRVKGCYAVIATLHDFLEQASAIMADHIFPERPEWLGEINFLRAQWPDEKELCGFAGINPNRFMHVLSRFALPAAAFVVDVGQHQMWAAQSLELQKEQRFLTCGGLGSMGFALPAAIGAVIASPGRPMVVIAGDGGFQCNIQELETVARNRLPLKLVVVNNRCHGMVRQFQESYFDKRYQSTLWGYGTPDFVRVSEAYNIPARTVREESNLKEALTWLWADPLQPALLEVQVDTYTNAYPKIAFGHPITEMEPFAKPVEMEGT